MKALTFLSIAVLFLSCSETKTLSPSETAKIVAESFYHGDKNTLKKHTTSEGYANLLRIQNMFLKDEKSATEFRVIDEFVGGDIAWIKYSVAYDSKSSVFKLVKVDGSWKVTHNGPRDKGPF